MALGSAGYVSIVELIIYVPCLVLAVLVCIRHGWRRSGGWLYTFILCLVRIIGAICQLVTYTSPSEELYQTVFTIDSIGLSPLLFATMGVINRMLDVISSQGTTLFPRKVLRAVNILIIVSLIVGITGGSTTTPSPDGSTQPSAAAKVGSILYIVAFGFLTFIFTRSVSSWGLLPGPERRVPFAVAIAWPFILVRLLYSIFVVFLNDSHFSVVNGSVAVRAAMSVAEEMIVVMIYLALAFTLPKFEPPKVEEEELSSRVEEPPPRRQRGYQ